MKMQLKSSQQGPEQLHSQYMYQVPTFQNTETTPVPELWTSVHQVKDLSRVEELLELAEKLHPLVVTAFGVAQDQERAAARG